ncbi:uncharacterized protein [Ptychodera flava]|uniref:uncharacterized protein n=1 Tax=Ptychodera flava TaxID=63121 RepID=UPI003969CEAF
MAAPIVNILTRSDAILLCHPSMEDLAESIKARCSQLAMDMESRDDSSDKAYMRQISRGRQNIELKTKAIKWEKFPDGWPNLFIDDVKNCYGRDVIFIGSFHSPEVVFEQLSILYAIPRYLARSFTCILPYFPTGTMERVDTEGQIATAKTLATLLSAIPYTARGPAQLVIYDIHALQERFYFSDGVIPRLESAIPLLLREIQTLPDRENVCIAFPDDGAFKRFHTSFEGFDTITCVKIREGKQRIVQVKDGNPRGKKVIIVDDLIQTGGTLKNCAKALLDRGASAISAYVTHAVFPNKSWESFVDSQIRFQEFWITDSIPHAKEISQHPPFKLLSLCDAVSEMLFGFDLLQG